MDFQKHAVKPSCSQTKWAWPGGSGGSNENYPMAKMFIQGPQHEIFIGGTKK